MDGHAKLLDQLANNYGVQAIQTLIRNIRPLKIRIKLRTQISATA